MSRIAKLIISILIPLVVGFTSSFFTASGVSTWFQTIEKPSWNPPNWVFAPVWTSLYILMGISLFLIWKNKFDQQKKRTALILFAFQLLLNFLWSFIFFGQHQIGWALADIVVLWLALLATIFAFAPLNRTAAWLLVPYISWVSFAALLNFSIWTLNKLYLISWFANGGMP